jgi:hypothetical protein
LASPVLIVAGLAAVAFIVASGIAALFFLT